MNKPFTFVLPDEPYSNLTTKNNTVDCVYTGARYLMLDVEEDTGYVQSVVGRSEKIDNLPNLECRIPGHQFIIFDALDNLVAAAYFTHQYTHGEVADYEEQVPGGKYTYAYADGTGIIGQVLYHGGIKYNFQTKNFNPPEYRLHANTREQTFSAFALNAANIDKALKEAPDYFSTEDKQKLEEHSAWLKQSPVAYANVAHWKIPFPTDIPALPPV